MIISLAESARHLLVRWTDLVREWAKAVVVISLLGVVAAAVYVASHLAVNTNTYDMLSPELPFRRAERAIDEAFPQYLDTIVIVVDGETAELADRAAAAMVARLGREPSRFGSIFYPQGDPFFRRNGFLYLDVETLRALSDRLAQAQPFLGTLSSDPSLRGLFELLTLAINQANEAGGNSAIDLAPVLSAIAEVVEAQTAGRFERLSWQRLIAGDSESIESGTRRLIVIKPPLDFASLQPAAAAINRIRMISHELSLDDAHGVRVRLTGDAALAHEEMQSINLDVSFAGMLSFALVVSLLWLCFRSFRLVVATAVTLIAGLIWTATFAVTAVGPLNLISVAFAVLFIGVGVDFGIRHALRYQEALDRGTDHAGALRQAASGGGGALTLGAIAVAFGFYSFVPTDYVGLAELGLIAGTGMIIALFATVTLLPALLALMPPLPRGDGGQDIFREGALTRAIERHARSILWAALVLGIAAVVLLPRARFDFDPLNLKNPESQSVRTLLDLMRDGQVGIYSVGVLTESLDAARILAAKIAALDTVRSTITLADLIPANQDEKLDIIGTMALLLEPSLTAPPKSPPTEAETIAALGDLTTRLKQLAGREHGDAAQAADRLLNSLSALPGGGRDPSTLAELQGRLLAGLPEQLAILRDSLSAEPVTVESLPAELRLRWVAADGRARIEILPKENLHRNPEALRHFIEDVRTVAPNVAGAPVVILEAGRTVIRAFIEAAVLAVAAIAVLLVMLLRSLRDVALVFAPLILAAVLTVGVSAVFNLPFNFANVIVLPLLFGLGVAGSVQVVMREREEGEHAAALNSSTPRAVVFTALTTIASFGSLALSRHSGMASMGLLLTIALTLTLACTLAVLPALMAKFGREEVRPAADSVTDKA